MVSVSWSVYICSSLGFAHTLTMNIFNTKDTFQNSIEEEFDIPLNLDLLNKLTIPKVEPKKIYQIWTIDRLWFNQIIKTTGSWIPLNNQEIILRLLNKKDLTPYKNTHKFLYIKSSSNSF